MKKSDFADIKSQSQFCTELMLRLNADIKKAGEGSWSGMENHIRKQNDIVRLRRELRDLFNLLDPWKEE